jgi:hypothetical protein
VGHGILFVNDRFARATTENGDPKGDDHWALLRTVVERGASLGSGAIIFGGGITIILDKVARSAPALLDDECCATAPLTGARCARPDEQTTLRAVVRHEAREHAATRPAIRPRRQEQTFSR